MDLDPSQEPPNVELNDGFIGPDLDDDLMFSDNFFDTITDGNVSSASNIFLENQGAFIHKSDDQIFSELCFASSNHCCNQQKNCS